MLLCLMTCIRFIIYAIHATPCAKPKNSQFHSANIRIHIGFKPLEPPLISCPSQVSTSRSTLRTFLFEAIYELHRWARPANSFVAEIMLSCLSASACSALIIYGDICFFHRLSTQLPAKPGKYLPARYVTALRMRCQMANSFRFVSFRFDSPSD